jgi:hypothetical protein
LIEFSVATPPQEFADTGEETMAEGHQSSPSDARSTRAIALEWISQSRVSRFSLARPCAVML